MLRPRPKPKNHTGALQLRTRTQTRTRRHTNATLVFVVGTFWAMLLGSVDANATPLDAVTPSVTIGQRRRTQETDPLTLSLDFSLWFPSAENVLAAVARSSDIDSSSNSNNTSNNDLFVSSDIVAGVLEALLELLCTATDMNVMDLFDQDVCVLHNYAKQQSRLPTTVQEDPKVTVRKQDLETLLPIFGNNNNKVLPNKEYYAWTVQYILVQLSDTYLQHATTTTTATNNAEEQAMRTMEQSIQLALDLSIMEGDFDLLLAKHMPPATTAAATPIAVYSSPTGREGNIFGKLAVDLLLAAMPSSSSSRQDTMSTYETEAWNPMRTSGLALLGSMLVLCMTLGLLAGRRRTSIIRTLEQANETKTAGSLTPDKEDTKTAFMLQSPEGVDSFLNQSTSFRTRRSGPTGNSRNIADGDWQDEDDADPRTPLPFQLQ
jgi:hypothetical protein